MENKNLDSNTLNQIQNIEQNSRIESLIKRVYDIEQENAKQSAAYTDLLARIKDLLEIIGKLRNQLDELDKKFSESQKPPEEAPKLDLVEVIKNLFRRK